jgi:hypothetical protein
MITSLNDFIFYILSFFISTIKKDLQIQKKLKERFCYEDEEEYIKIKQR